MIVNKKIMFAVSLLLVNVDILSAEAAKDIAEPEVIDLTQTTQLFVDVIRRQQLHLALEEKIDEAMAEKIVYNFSPASMALEIEVLNELRSVMVGFFEDEAQENEYRSLLEELSQQYHLKIVTINNSKLYSLVDAAQISKFPSFAIIRDRKEQGFIEAENQEQIRPSLEKLIEDCLKEGNNA